jgi:pimeloyl-ACP methyl ester carboxylesterase
MSKKVLIIGAVLGIGIALFLKFYIFSMPRKHGHVELKLFLAASEDQPLIVAFGGSEGGNVLASDQLKQERDKFLERGYAFLAVGYFGTKTTPASLDRISLNAIHDSIASIISRHSRINKNKVALYGGSRGGELILNLASRYKDYDAVIAIVPSNVTLPTRFGWGATSSWSFFDEEVPYLSSTNTSDRGASGDFFNELSRMLADEQAVSRAAISVERINGPILLLSAEGDEVWPSTLMCNKMMERLKSNHFNYPIEHIALEGSHAAAAQNSAYIFDFLEKHFRSGKH